MSNTLLESLWARIDTNIGSRITKISELLTQSLSANDESKAARDAAAASATEAKNHADRAELATDISGLRDEVTQQIAAVVDGSPADLDTIREVAEYAQANRGVTDQLNAAIGNKANKGHTHTTSEVTGLDDALNGKSDTGHKHVSSDITDSSPAGDGSGGKLVRWNAAGKIETSSDPSSDNDLTRKSYVDAKAQEITDRVNQRPAIFTVPDINSASTDNLVPGDVVVDTSTWIFYYLK